MSGRTGTWKNTEKTFDHDEHEGREEKRYEVWGLRTS